MPKEVLFTKATTRFSTFFIAISWSNRIPTKIVSQEEGVDDPNFVDAFNAYSRNGTASGLPVYVNFGRIEDFEVVSPSYYSNPFIFGHFFLIIYFSVS